MWNNEIGMGEKEVVCYGSADIRPTLLKDFQQLRQVAQHSDQGVHDSLNMKHNQAHHTNEWLYKYLHHI